MILCDYGCGKEAIFQYKNGKNCCSSSRNKCIEMKKKNSKGNIGSFRTEETKEKMRISRRKQVITQETKQKISKTKSGRKNEKQREYMLNGGAVKAIKGIKRISKEELKLREMVKYFYPQCEFQYKVFNYALDIALVQEKIAIEYDGHYHFDKPEHIQYFQFRQNKIETEGWRFLRYTIFDKFPNEHQIKHDIQRIIHD